MNDYEIQQMKDQLERLDSMLRLLAAKECNCMACMLNGCKCCSNGRDVDTLISDYEAERLSYQYSEEMVARDAYNHMYSLY